jgi:hypothetical protein
MQKYTFIIFLITLLSSTVLSQGLTITSRSPVINALNVTSDTNIEVVFDKNINSGTVDENTFNVDGSMTGEIPGAFNTSGGTVTFNPTNNFSPGEIVTVTITTSLLSSDVSSLTNPITWQFSVTSSPAAMDITGQEVITTSASGAEKVYAADIDGDGDMDVLSASYSDDKIAWYENTDGAGTFGSQQVISTSASGPQSVHAADIDGDGDMDVLSASVNDNKIAWYENTDGAGTFGAQQVITTSAASAYDVYAADIDGDGDMDVLSASYYDNKIAWYENTDGAGTFGTQQVITTSAGGALSVYSVDLDGDGDMDVLSASTNDNKIAWYENTDGAGTFSAQKVITTSAHNAKSVYAADLDGDGDLDVLSASRGDNKIAWYENTDGTGTFGAQQVITTSASGTFSVYSADLDGDGDMDVLSDLSSNNRIAWYENTDGVGTFGTQQVITTSTSYPYSVYSADLDGDGDMDVLSASYIDSKIAWYENKSLGTSADFAETINKNTVLTISSANITYSEPIQSKPQLSTKIVSAPGKGELFNDQDGNNIAGGAEILGNGDTISKADLDNGFLKYIPLPDESGVPYTNFTFKVVNSDGESSQTYNGTVNIGLLGPSIITNEGATIDQGGTFTFSDLVLKGEDPDGPDYSIAYNITQMPVHGSLTNNGVLIDENGNSFFTQNDIANGKIKYSHNGDESREDSIKFILVDSDGNTSDEATFLITINNVNNAPTVGTISAIIMKEDEEYALDLTSWYNEINDPDNADSTLTISVSCNDTNVTLSPIENNKCTISADENYFGNALLNVTISDGELSCQTTVDLTIESVNDFPVINGLPTSLSIINGDVENLDLKGMASDVETPDSMLTWSFTATPDSVNLNYNAETNEEYISAKGSFDGTVELTVTVTDADGGTDETTITVTVTPDPTSIEGLNGIPTEFTLFQNYPNPFNPSTVIRYGIPVGDAYHASLNVSLKIYDILGNEVATLVNEEKSPGYFEVRWNAENLASGIYFYRVIAGSYVECKKMLMIK